MRNRVEALEKELIRRKYCRDHKNIRKDIIVNYVTSG